MKGAFLPFLAAKDNAKFSIAFVLKISVVFFSTRLYQLYIFINNLPEIVEKS